MNIKRFIDHWKRRRILNLLTTSDPAVIEQWGARQLLPAFYRATRMPAYAQLLKEKGIDHRRIKTIAEFQKKIPIFTKHDFFGGRFNVKEICVDGNLSGMKLALSSSGFSGVYSYGINTHYNQKHIAFSIDTALEYVFKISKRKTFLVNCLPMGVKVPTELQIAETSVRSDMARAIIKKFSSHFDQILIVSDPHFLKKLVEDGLEEGMDWKKMNVSLILGEDWFSENFRRYLAQLLGIDFNHPEKGLIGSTMGVAELDFNLFHETITTVRIRQEMQNNPQLTEKLLGKKMTIAPILFHYYPHRMYLETTPQNELVFSMLSPHFLIPLIRYNSHDQGYIIPYQKLADTLKGIGRNDLIPDIKLPIVAVAGREGRWLNLNGKIVTPEEIKEGLYSDFEVAAITTGYFKMKQKDNKGIIEIQLKKGVSPTSQLQHKITKATLKYVDCDLEILIYPYQTFPYGMELDYERKFQPL